MLAIYRFFEDYVQGKDENGVKIPGKLRAVHKVEYGPLGGGDKCRTIALVNSLRPKLEVGESPQPGSAQEQAMVKWDFINAAYQKWKQGQEITPDGTPLGAWPAIGPEQAEALRRRDIHTVEQVAQLTDTHIGQFGIQGLRNLRDMATRYVNNAGTHQLEASLAEKDQQIAGLVAQQADMAQMLRDLQVTLAALQSGPAAGSVQTQGQNEPADNDDAFAASPVTPADDDVPVTTAPRRARGR